MQERSMKGADFTDLSSEILRGGNSIRFKAHGSSMLPWIKDGDILTIQPLDPDEIRIGQVVFYPSASERPIIHRVIRKEVLGDQRLIVTRGDASPRSQEQIQIEQVLGHVVRIHRGSKTIQVDRNLWWRLSQKWPGFINFAYLLERFRRRFQRYITLSPKASNREPRE